MGRNCSRSTPDARSAETLVTAGGPRTRSRGTHLGEQHGPARAPMADPRAESAFHFHTARALASHSAYKPHRNAQVWLRRAGLKRDVGALSSVFVLSRCRER